MTRIIHCVRRAPRWLLPWALLQAAGCGGEFPTAIAGKAIITVDGRELVLDSGDDGRRPVTVDTGDGDWKVRCYEDYGDLNMSLSDVSKGPGEFRHIRLVTLADPENTYVGVEIRIGYEQQFTGHCTGAVRGDVYTSPNKVKISVEPCDLPYGPEGVKARLEYASFHVTHCRPTVPPVRDAGADADAQ